jgi:RecA/RadA recombinase
MTKNTLDLLTKMLDTEVAEYESEKEHDSFIEPDDVRLTFALHGGFSRNRINVIAGDSGAGKTFLSIKHAAKLQKETGGIVIILDSEYYYHEKPNRIKRLEKMGLDLSRTIIKSSNNLNVLLGKIQELIDFQNETGEICCLVVDSIGSINDPSQAEKLAKTKDIQDASNKFGGMAKVYSMLMPMFIELSAEGKVTTFFVQHSAEEMGGGNPYAAPKKIVKGGKKMRYLSDVIILCETVNRKDSKIDTITGNTANSKSEFFSGKTIRITADKTRDGVEGRKAEMLINFDTCETQKIEDGLIELAQKLNIIYHPLDPKNGKPKMRSYAFKDINGDETQLGTVTEMNKKISSDKDIFESIKQQCLTSKESNPYPLNEDELEAEFEFTEVND